METTRATLVADRLQSRPDVRPAWVERAFAAMLSRLKGGGLCIDFPSGARRVVGDASYPLLKMEIHDVAFFKKVMAGGSVGLGEAYVDGLWTTPDLTALLELFAANQQHLGRLQRGFSLITLKANQLYHRARRNTPERSRENIQEHYDLSNDFYRTFLDASMTYSSALFKQPDEALEPAQARKIDRILDLAGAGEGCRLLEIGSGWGALALRAAQRGCQVKSITLSLQQYDYCLDLFQREGVADRIDIQLQDYRDLEGKFDAVVSCEMIEAVGKEYLPSYFETIRRSLKPGGRAALQAITIPDERYDRYCRSCDWIQKHIFPGGHLPSPAAIRAHARQSGDLAVERMDAFGRDYARTLSRWQSAFNKAEKQVEALGFDDRFRRKWNYYFSYCIAGFEQGLIDVKHIVLTASR